jgi:hypothetical protein
MPIDRAALVVGGIRLASGISFLVDPVRANRLWGDPEEPVGGARLLLYSMGYRDAADFVGGMSAHHQMRRSQQVIGLGGAVVGIAVGLWGATRQRAESRTGA